MITLFKDALLIPMTKENYSFKGDFVIDDNKILFVGKNYIGHTDNIVYLDNAIITPSFVNAHTHSAMTLMRNYKDNTSSLQSWLSEIWPIEDKLNKEDIYYGSKLAIGEMIKSGITTFADMYFMGEETIKATKEAGVNASISVTLFGDKKETERRLNEILPSLENETKSYKRIQVDIAPHSIYTVDKPSLVLAKEYALKENKNIHIHISETIKEVEDSIKENGMRPVEYLESIGLFEAKTFAAHAVHLNEKEILTLKGHNVKIVHNPSSNCKLGSGIAPISKYLENGLIVSLGTDGASSNNNLNMLKELNLASLISSASSRKANNITSYQILEMATISGAKALGVEHRIGTLEKGKDADFIIFDMSSSSTTPLNNPFSAIVFSSDRKNIKETWSNGKCIFKDNKLLTLDEKGTIKEVNSRWENLLRR